MNSGFNLLVKELVSDGNVRMDVDAELSASIRQHGIKVPIEVYRKDNRWVIQDGHRRFNGAVVAGLDVVPCIQIDEPADGAEKIAEQYIINEHRKPLTKLDKATVYQNLKDTYGWAQKDIASTFGISEGEVSLSLAALQAAPSIRDALLEGRISHSAVEPVLALSEAHQEAVAPLVLHARTVRGVADVVKTYRAANGIERGIRAPRPTVQAKAAVDPMEHMAVDGIETALRNLKLAEAAILSDHDLIAKANSLLAEVVRVASRIRVQLDTAEPAAHALVDEDEFAEI